MLPPGTARSRVWALAVPVILANLSVPLLGMVDTAVMGHLDSPAYLGAVAVGALVFDYLYWSFGFLRMGTTGPTAQAIGAGDGAEARAVFGRAFLIGVTVALGLWLVQAPVRTAALALLEGSAEVESLAATYFSIRIWSAPAALVQFAQIGWLMGLGRAKAVLAQQVVANILNICLNLTFVLGLGMDVDGVALATVIAEYTGMVVGFLLMAPSLKALPGGGWDRARLLDPVRLKKLVGINGDIFVRTLCLISAFAWFTAKGAEAGDVTLAANAVLLTFLTIASYGLDGFAHAAETLVGGAVGARNRAALREAVTASTGLALALSAGMAALFLLGGPSLIAVLTGLPEVRAAAGEYLPWAVVLPLVAVWGFQFDGIFLGATESRPLRNMMILCLAAFLALSALLLPAWGNHGLWAAFTVFMALRGASLAALYPRMERRVTAPSGGRPPAPAGSAGPPAPG